ncbi:MAG: histidine phosphatase family protein [Verrucomicrobiales bacterium]|nr:histidine phosphatase family protein [Verrucomicrobiales bacterium]
MSSSPTTRLLFLRHAEVEEAYHRVFGGRIDMAISALGRNQAAALAEYVSRKFSIDAIYASPMKRVQMTLEPLRARLPLAPVLVDDLREVDFGAWTGLRWDQISERFGVTAYDWLDSLERGAMPDAEPEEIFRRRVDRALKRIFEEQSGRTIAVACHGGVIRMALAVLLELPLHKMTHLEIDYASLTWVDCTGRKREMQLQNFTPWRDL